ncbi:hypothetical protein D3C72_985820 [compost metagenome]
MHGEPPTSIDSHVKPAINAGLRVAVLWMALDFDGRPSQGVVIFVQYPAAQDRCPDGVYGSCSDVLLNGVCIVIEEFGAVFKRCQHIGRKWRGACLGVWRKLAVVIDPQEELLGLCLAIPVARKQGDAVHTCGGRCPTYHLFRRRS